MLWFSRAETGENLSLTGEISTSVSTGNTDNQYETAKIGILSILPREIVTNIENLFVDFEIATDDSTFSQTDKRKEILQNIVNSIAVIVITSWENQAWTISKSNMDFVIMPNICIITSSYNIDSTICNNGVYSESTEPEDNGIMIVLLIIVIGLIAIWGVRIWHRVNKKSAKIQSYITIIWITLIASLIFIGSYDSIDFKWIGLFIWGFMCLFIGLAIFFSYKARKIAKENKLQEDKKQKILDLFHASTKAFEEGKNEEALNMCNETLKAIENSWIPNHKERDFYKIVEKYQESLKKSYDLLEEALKINKNDKESFIKACETLSILWKNEEAIKIYREVIEKFKDDKKIFYNFWTLLIDVWKYEEALEMLNKAINLDKEFKEAYHNTWISLWKLWKYEEALEAFNKAINLDKCFTIAYLNKGLTLGILWKAEEEIKTYHEAIKNITYDSDIYFSLWLALYKLWKTEEALEIYNNALKINPLDKNICLNKSSFLLSLERNEEALECLNYLLTKIDPWYMLAYVNKWITLGKLWKYEKALEILNKAIQIDPNHANTYYNKSYVCFKKNDIIEALEAFNKAIEIDPTYKEKAKKDDDFKDMFKLDEFKNIIWE